MDKNEFLSLLAETIQTDELLQEDTMLMDIEEWDSLAALTTVGLFSRLFQINLTTNDIGSCETVADLIKKTQGKVSL